MTEYLGLTANGREVYYDEADSHAPLHTKDDSDLLAFVRKALPCIEAVGANVYAEVDLGREIGRSALVKAHEDEVFYAKRIGRETYGRFVTDRPRKPTSYLTVVLHQQPDCNYNLWSVWYGRAVPSTPGGLHASPESETFWRGHALIVDMADIQGDTMTTYWPW